MRFVPRGNVASARSELLSRQQCTCALLVVGRIIGRANANTVRVTNPVAFADREVTENIICHLIRGVELEQGAIIGLAGPLCAIRAAGCEVRLQAVFHVADANGLEIVRTAIEQREIDIAERFQIILIIAPPDRDGPAIGDVKSNFPKQRCFFQ